MNVVLIVLVVSLIKNCVSQSPCVTPNGENGICIVLNNCEAFTSIWNQRTTKHIAFLRKSHCGFEGGQHLICCGSVAEMTEINNQNITPDVAISTTESLTRQLKTETTTTTSETTTKTSEPILFTSSPVSMTTTESAPITSPPILITTESAPITSPPIPMTTPAVSMTTSSVSVTTDQLFTSPIVTNTPRSTESIPNRLSTFTGFSNHPRFNLLPPRGQCGINTSGQKISNGNVTDIDAYPWLAMLLYKFDNNRITAPNCGGSLINSKYVLTAAHCIKGNLFSVRLGEYDLDKELDCVIEEGDEVCADPYQEFRIEDFHMFRGYSSANVNRYHDIALIRMKGEVTFTDFIHPICLPINNERSNPGDYLTVSGWGLTENNITSKIKLAVDVPIWSDQSCQEIYSIGYAVNISSRQFCAGGQAGKDSCGGDSGGPLMKPIPNETAFYVEGIVSFGPQPCGRQATPGVYIRVSEYMTWILDTMMP